LDARWKAICSKKSRSTAWVPSAAGWARLAAQGARLGCVARGATLAALREHGLRLVEAGADGQPQERAFAVQAAADPAELGEQDLVIVAVKAPAMAEVARHIAPLLGPRTVVLTAMNGVPWWFLQGFGGALAGTRLASVDADGAIERAIPARQVIGCVVHASCSLDAPGVVRRHFGNGLIVGEPAGGDSPRLAALAALLRAAGFDTTVSPQIQKDVWYKLWGNMTINPISAFTGVTADRVLDDELARGFVSAVMLEARDRRAHRRADHRDARGPPPGHAQAGRVHAFHAAGRARRQAGGDRRAGRRGARAGPAGRCGHALHRRAAGPGPLARAPAGPLLMAPSGPRWAGFLALTLIALLMASNHVAARLAFDHGVTVATAVAFRSTGTALAVGALLVLQRVPVALSARERARCPPSAC
jgi:2-dehydropantoate 2-reductase